MLIFHADEPLAKWAGDKLGMEIAKPNTSIGVAHRGKIVAVAVFTLLFPEVARNWRTIVLFVFVLGVSVATTEWRATWSAYNHLSIRADSESTWTMLSRPPTPPANLQTMQDPPSYLLSVNQNFYQYHRTIDIRRFTPGTPAYEATERFRISYLIPYAFQSAPRNVAVVGAGLPQLAGRMGKAKSYAERLFEFPQIGPLNETAARTAIAKPAAAQKVKVDDAALELIFKKTHGYAYFLQEWGKHAWDAANRSPITRKDVDVASKSAVAALDESFFRVRFDRLTPAEKRYLRAMAELGPGPHRSGDIADELKREVTKLGPTRNQLIGKGMVWSPTHGDTAFTVPLFDEFMHRVMPGEDWKT